MADAKAYIILIICLSILIGGSAYLILSFLRSKEKKKEEEEEIIEDTFTEYEENYATGEHEEEITPEKSIVDLLLKYHRNELLSLLHLSNPQDIDYVVLTYLNELLKGSYLERFPFWSILHAKESKHSLVMLKNALESITDEEYLKVRDVIFAWMNYVFDLDKELVQHRDYVGKEDLIKIIDDLLQEVG